MEGARKTGTMKNIMGKTLLNQGKVDTLMVASAHYWTFILQKLKCSENEGVPHLHAESSIRWSIKWSYWKDGCLSLCS